MMVCFESDCLIWKEIVLSQNYFLEREAKLELEKQTYFCAANSKFVPWKAKRNETRNNVAHFVGARLSIPALRNPFRMERHFEWPYEVDLRCAPLGPRKKKTHFEWKVTLGPCFVLDSRAVLRACQPSIRKINPERNPFWMDLRRYLRCVPLGPCFENHFERKLVPP